MNFIINSSLTGRERVRAATDYSYMESPATKRVMPHIDQRGKNLTAVQPNCFRCGFGKCIGAHGNGNGCPYTQKAELATQFEAVRGHAFADLEEWGGIL